MSWKFIGNNEKDTTWRNTDIAVLFSYQYAKNDFMIFALFAFSAFSAVLAGFLHVISYK